MDIEQQSAAPDAAPAITKVVDGTGTELENPDTTQNALLTLSGGGTPNAVVLIFDNAIHIGPASVTASGTWAKPLNADLGPHRFTVRATDGSESQGWVIIIAEAELDLPEPTVTQAPGGTLDPVDAAEGATVVVAYDMQLTDIIGLSWYDLDSLVPPLPGSPGGSLTFTIPASAVAAVMGKTIAVRYAVLRQGVATPSRALNLMVQTLDDSDLEAPRILQAPDDLHLDVGALNGDADLTVKPWPLIEAGQRISLRFEGTKADGSAYSWVHPIWQNLPIDSTDAPGTTVALDDLKELGDGTDLKLIFEVSFDGGITNLSFPARTLTIRAKKFVSGFENWQTFGAVGGHIFLLNSPLHCPSGLVATLIKDVPAGGAHTYIFNYSGSGEWALRVATGATIKLEFGGWVNRLSFNHYWGIDNNWVNFYDEADNLVHVHHVVGQGNVDIILPRPCLWCWIAVYNASTGLGVDNIGWS